MLYQQKLFHYHMGHPVVQLEISLRTGSAIWSFDTKSKRCTAAFTRQTDPKQEQKCEESFWKSCKIDFREMPYNYTMKQCHTPLVKECDTVAPSYAKPEIVCKTWFEAECNTTFSPARLLTSLFHALYV